MAWQRLPLVVRRGGVIGPIVLSSFAAVAGLRDSAWPDAGLILLTAYFMLVAAVEESRRIEIERRPTTQWGNVKAAVQANLADHDCDRDALNDAMDLAFISTARANDPGEAA